MLKFSRTDDLRVELYEKRINAKNYVFMDRQKIKDILEYEKARSETHRYMARRLMDIKSARGVSDMGRNSVINYLLDYEGCTKKELTSGKSGNLSLDAKDVITPLLDKGKAVEFLTEYSEHSSLNSQCNRASGLLNILQEHGEVSYEGRPISRIYFSVNQQENMRYNYKDADLISIPSAYNSCYTVEEDEVIVWGDLPQADFRVLYNTLLRNKDTDKIMLQHPHDVYEGMAHLVSILEGDEEFALDVFKSERDLYKVYLLETAYGQQSGRTQKERDAVARFNRFFSKVDRYQKYKQRIQKRIDLGLPIPITGYFGETQLVPIDFKRPKNTLNKALNTPIQTGTSQIIILLVNKILDDFYALGYTEEDVGVYMVRHDEPIFRMKKHVLKDAWVLDNAGTILVDDWMPMKLEFFFGHYYEEEDEELTALAMASYEANKHRHTIFEPDETAEQYMPTPETFVLSVGYQVLPNDKTVISYYHSDSHSVKYELVHSSDLNEVYASIRRTCSGLEDILLRRKVNGVIVYNPLREDNAKDNFLYYKYTLQYNDRVVLANTLAHYIGAKFAKRENLANFEIRWAELEANKTAINSVGELDEFLSKEG